MSGAAHLFEFSHQIGLGMKTSRRINDYVVAVARSSSLQSIVEHSGGIASGLGANYLSARALSPDFELLDGGSTKKVRRRQPNRFVIPAGNPRHFAERCC